MDNYEFNNNNSLRTDEIHKIKTLIYSEDDSYLKDEIKSVNNNCNLLRNKILDNWTDVIDITKTAVAPSEPKEPGIRGRKPSVVTLEKLQTKYYKMYDDLEKQLRAMKELSSKINDYKNYFGK